MATAGDLPVIVRTVWANNLDEEFGLISACLPYYSFVGLDTEFPGVVVTSESHPVTLSEERRYSLMKRNVECMNVIQVGLTLSDAEGRLPTFGTGFSYVWEFNFADFNVYTDLCNPTSVGLLQSHGIDFDANIVCGISSVQFVLRLLNSGMLCNDSHITWVTFHGAYDFAYLIKSLMWVQHGILALPENLDAFMAAVGFYFGKKVYDVKHMTKYTSNLFGGLDNVAQQLQVVRVVGERHQSGSDSLVSLLSFLKMKTIYFGKDFEDKKFAGIIYGLQSS